MKQDLIKEILICGLDDWLYLAEVASMVQCSIGVPVRTIAVMEPSLRLVEQLLQNGLIQVGDLPESQGSSFRPWNMRSEEVIDALRNQWLALEKPISLGEICWLSLTEKGTQEAKRIIANGEAPPGIAGA
jgi:hypothetical protein